MQRGWKLIAICWTSTTDVFGCSSVLHTHAWQILLLHWPRTSMGVYGRSRRSLYANHGTWFCIGSADSLLRLSSNRTPTWPDTILQNLLSLHYFSLFVCIELSIILLSGFPGLHLSSSTSIHDHNELATIMSKQRNYFTSKRTVWRSCL